MAKASQTITRRRIRLSIKRKTNVRKKNNRRKRR